MEPKRHHMPLKKTELTSVGGSISYFTPMCSCKKCRPINQSSLHPSLSLLKQFSPWFQPISQEWVENEHLCHPESLFPLFVGILTGLLNNSLVRVSCSVPRVSFDNCKLGGCWLIYLDEQQQVDILRLGSLTVLVANVVLLNVNTLNIREE
jgi:hypothetical protein